MAKKKPEPQPNGDGHSEGAVPIPAVSKTVFDDAVSKAVANGSYHGMEDAKTGLEFFIHQKDIDNAEKMDESNCVLGVSLGRCQVMEAVLSIGMTVVKIFFPETGKITRYGVPRKIKHALAVFDRKGIWLLAPGPYILPPPNANNKMAKNLTKEQRQARRDRWDETKQRFKKGKASGKGVQQFKCPETPLTRGRQVTTIKGPRIPS